MYVVACVLDGLVSYIKWSVCGNELYTTVVVTGSAATVHTDTHSLSLSHSHSLSLSPHGTVSTLLECYVCLTVHHM
jgi:hypothetical protein